MKQIRSATASKAELSKAKPGGIETGLSNVKFGIWCVVTIFVAFTIYGLMISVDFPSVQKKNLPISNNKKKQF